MEKKSESTINSDMLPLVIDPVSLTYIVLQRTDYFSLTGFPFRRLPFRLRATLETALFPKKISYFFSNDMHAEYTSLKEHLPKHIETILDVGCGIGGIDALIAREHPETTFIMFDKTKLDEHVYHGFEKEGSFYNSLELTRSFLQNNDVEDKRIYTVDVSEKERAFIPNSVDVILSLISWGFHYPVETYLEDAFYALKPNGVLILDIRANTNGEEMIKRRFGNIAIIDDRGKQRRVKAVRTA